MPRKQRFKPSRKPQNQGTVSSQQQVDDRKDMQSDVEEIGRSAPVRDEQHDVEPERG
jgi:hypothetical protein